MTHCKLEHGVLLFSFQVHVLVDQTPIYMTYICIGHKGKFNVQIS